MVKVIPVASGKGGVGKSVIALNLATALADRSRAVVLGDFDLGGATQHLLMGLSIKGSDSGLGSLIYNKEKHLENLITSTGYKRLHFIAGDQMMVGTSQLDEALKHKIIGQMREVVADYLIVDLGAGSHYSIVDMFLNSYCGLVIVSPEITSVMGAYLFLKTAVFRFIYRFYKIGSKERVLVKNFLANRIEGSKLSYRDLLDKLKEEDSASAMRLQDELSKFKPILIINMSRDSKDMAWIDKLQEISKKKLNLEFSALVALPVDVDLKESVDKREPLGMYRKNNKFIVQLGKLVDVIENYSLDSLFKSAPRLYNDDGQM